MTMSIPVPTAFELYFAARTAAPGGQELEELERLFFDSIALRNGTFKTTWHRRLEDLNALVQRLLPPQRPLEIMDVAVSSGVSTAEWLLSLERAGIDCHMLAGDAVVNAFLISVGRLRALTDRTGHMMQLDIAGRAVRMPPPRRRDKLRYLPLTLLMKCATRLFDLSASTHASARNAGQTRLGVTCQPLALTSPSLARMSKLSAVEDDILLNTSYTRRFHVLRAANILNLAYFDSGTLERMLMNLRSRLVPGGLLIVCRTNEAGVNNASVFTLGEDGRFGLTARLNRGSEIADLVLRLPPECQQPV
jgi:hypothetical protein